MKTVLRLMALNFLGERRVLFYLWVVLVVVATFMQLTFLAEVPRGRTTLFYAELLIVWPFLVPMATRSRQAVGRTLWWLLPWGRLKHVSATALLALLASCVGSLLYAVAVTACRTGLRDFFHEALISWPTLFSLVSLMGLPLITQSRSEGWRQLTVYVVMAFLWATMIHGMNHDLPRVTQAPFGNPVWVVCAIAVAIWLIGGAWYAFVAKPRSPGDPRAIKSSSQAGAPSHEKAVATLLKARWSKWDTWPTLGILILGALGLLAVLPAETASPLLLTSASLAILFSLRIVRLAQITASRARVLWLRRGSRQAVLRECERILFKEMLTATFISWPLLLGAAWLMGRTVSGPEVFHALLTSFALPSFFGYAALLHMALPEQARGAYWFSVFTLVLAVNVGVVVSALVSNLEDANGLLGGQAIVLALLTPASAALTRRVWKKMDWTFLPSRREGFLAPP